MGVSSYFEFVTTLFGWVMYDNLWGVLNTSGLVYIPFITVILGHVIASRKGGDDEGSAPIQSLKKIETDVVLMIVVLMLCVVPSVDVTLGEMQYTRPALNCELEALSVQGDDTGTTYDGVLQTLGGEAGRAPLWWAVLHTVSKSIVSASLAAIPCSFDLTSIDTRLSNNKLEDPRLRKDVEEFYRDCYTPASSRFLRNHTAELTEDELHEMSWIGSQFFLETPGYYDKYYAYNPRDDWAFDDARDQGFEADRTVDNRGGHPLCNEWWNNAAVGLRNQILDSVDDATFDAVVAADDGLIAKVASFFGENPSLEEREDIFLRKYLAVNVTAGYTTTPAGGIATSYSVSNSDRTQQSLHGGLGDFVTTVGGNVLGTGEQLLISASAVIGGALGLPAALAEGEVIRQGVSMFQNILVLMMIILLPFMLVISEYKIATVLTLSVIMFALHFFSFIWGIAFWADNNLTAALLTGNGIAGALSAATNPIQLTILLWVQRFFYIVFPMIFLTMMGWVGFRAGQLGNIMSGQIMSATVPAKQGGNTVASAVGRKI